MNSLSPPETNVIFTSFPVVFPSLTFSNGNHIRLLIAHDIIHRKKEMDGIGFKILPSLNHPNLTPEINERFLRKLDMSPSFLDQPKTNPRLFKRGIVSFFSHLMAKGDIFQQDCFLFYCGKCHAIIPNSDVAYREITETYYHILYEPVKKNGPRMTVVTAHPETILGDTALAIHPEDKRFSREHGGDFSVPIIEHHIPVIKDKKVNRNFGTGIIHISPQNHPFDFDMALRHQLPIRITHDLNGKMTDQVPRPFRGLYREKCRSIVLDKLKRKKLIEKQDTGSHRHPFCPACNGILQPSVSVQWFQKKASGNALNKAIKNLHFYPERSQKKFIAWTTHSNSWRISTPLKNQYQVPDTRNKKNHAYFDPRFLDTIYPYMNTLPPHKEQKFPQMGPISFLIAGTDPNSHQFFRFLSTGIQIMDHSPFRDILLLHNSRNVFFDNTLIDQETFRLSMIDEKKSLAKHQKFHDKLQIISTVLEQKLPSIRQEKNTGLPLSIIDQWIYHLLNATVKKINDQMENYKIQEAARILIRFVHNEYIKWYLGFFKIPPPHEPSHHTMFETFLIILRLLHPFLPALSQNIYQKIAQNPKSPGNQPFPSFSHHFVYPKAYGTIEKMKQLIGEIKKLQSENLHILGKKKDIILKTTDKKEKIEIERSRQYFSCFFPENHIVFLSDEEKVSPGIKGAVSRWEIILPMKDEQHRKNTLEMFSGQLTSLKQEISDREKKIAGSSSETKKNPVELIRQKKELQKLFFQRDKIQKKINDIT